MKFDKMICSIIAVLLGTLIILTGCGGGGGGTGATTPTNTASLGYNISGTVTAGSAGMQGVTITLTTAGGTSPATVTDANGRYTFTGLANGSYTLTPSLSGSTFTPASLTVTISGADLTGNDFAAAAAAPAGFGISGVITEATSTGPGIAGLFVTLSDASLTSSSTVSTNANGNYTFAGLANGTYTVTPSAAGFLFSSASLTVTINSADSPGNNFTVSNVYSLSGAITTTQPSGLVSGVTLTISGASFKFIPTTTALSDVSGNYTFVGLLNDTYTVTPSKNLIYDAATNLVTMFTFTPSNRLATISDANQPAIDFVSTATITSAHSISGTITPGTATFGTIIIPGVKVSLRGSNLVTPMSTTTDANGNFTFVGVPNGTYTVSPANFDTGSCPTPVAHSFVPISTPVTIKDADLSGIGFVENAAKSGCARPI